MNRLYAGLVWMLLSAVAAAQDNTANPVGDGLGSVVCMSFDEPTSQQNGSLASCAPADNATYAGVNAASGELELLAIPPQGIFTLGVGEFAESQAAAALGDLVTITEGFDDNGVASGEIEILVSAALDNSIGSFGDFTALVVLWYPDENAPACTNEAQTCGLFFAGYEFAQIRFSIDDGVVESRALSGQGGGRVIVNDRDSSNLQALLEVPWTVPEDAPSFYFSVATEIREAGGSGFFSFDFGDPQENPGQNPNISKVGISLIGADGFRFAGKGGALRRVAAAELVSDNVRLSGRVENEDGAQLTAMVLASGQYLFSNRPAGRYDLAELPREPDGSVRRQVYASGFLPRVESVQGSTAEPIVLEASGRCPNYNAVSMPVARAESAGRRHRVSGRVFAQNRNVPVRAMVLVNGQYDFADDNGYYEVEFPLDANGQFIRQVYASGFAPSIEQYDASTTSLDIRLARANECR